MLKTDELLNERTKTVLLFFVSYIDDICQKYAVDKMDQIDYINIKDVMKMQRKVDLNYPTVKINDTLSTILPSQKTKYDNFYEEKLDKMINNLVLKL